MHPWFKLENEPIQAYESFQYYLFLPSDSRSIDTAYRACKGHTEGAKKASGQWTRYFSLYNWSERAKAYDEFIATQTLIQRQADVITEAQEKIKAREAQEMLEGNIAAQLLERVDEMLSWPLYEDTITETYEDGRAKTVIRKPVKWNFSNIGQGLEVWSKLSRLSLGMVTDKSQVDTTLLLDEAAKYFMKLASEALDSENYQKLEKRIKQLN
jgi:hypothetical protein